MNLSDRPRHAAPAARPSARPAEPPPGAPGPKALCPACGRPVAMARLGRCLYCGGAVEVASPEPVAQAAPAAPRATPDPALPPEVLLALAPRVVPQDTRRFWMLRLGALAIVALLLVLLVAFTGGRPD